MGIHNLAIVIPQFAVSTTSQRPRPRTDGQVALIASVIFQIADGGSPTEVPGFAGDKVPATDKTGVAWVLRFGGLMASVSLRLTIPASTAKT